MSTYEVVVANYFDAESHEDAVLQMIAWLIDSAHEAGYRVTLLAEDADAEVSRFIDADDLPYRWTP